MVFGLSKSAMRKKTLEDMRAEILREIKAEQTKGTLDGPLDFEGKWETLRAPIFDNLIVSASFVYLNITEEEVKGMLRKAYEECGVKLMDAREALARQLFYEKYPPSNDDLAYNLRWEDIPFDGCSSSQPFYDEAEQRLSP